MKLKNKIESMDSGKLFSWVSRIMAIGTLLTAGAFAAYFIHFHSGFSTDHQAWGTFGDFIGGTLNPLLSFLALLALLLTIVLQSKQIELSSKELALSRDELELTRLEVKRSADSLSSQDKNMAAQRAETTFFNLLENLERCRREIRFSSIPRDISGRDAIERIYSTFSDQFLHEVEHDRGVPKLTFRKECQSIEGVKSAYRNFYGSELGTDLGQYFRLIYHAIKFVDESTSIDNKKFYINILRAQLSRYELCLLMYNAISEFGEQKLLPLINKYELLKHIEVEKIPPKNHFILEFFSGRLD